MKPAHLLVFAAISALSFTQPVLADDWSDWYSVADGHLNRVDVRYQKSTLKASDGRCDIKFQFRNRYRDRVSFTYQVVVDGGRVETTRVEELGGNGQTSDGHSYARNTREIGVRLSNLRAAGSQFIQPRE